MAARTWWRGVQLDTRTAAMMDEVARLAAGIPLHPSQGSWSGLGASAGTHAGCGAIDLTRNSAAECDAIVAHMRRVGFAAWHRTPQQADWVRHVHGIAVQPGGKYAAGCLHPAAASQVIDYYEGRNGLAGRGPDDATRAHVGVTWETYRDQRPPPVEWLIEGVLPMSVPAIVFFTHNGTQYEAAVLAGTYRAYTSGAKMTARRDMLKKLGIPFRVEQGSVANPAAYGRRVQDV